MSQQKLFAVGDIHGCSEELGLLLEKMPLSPGDSIVFLGDYIDRGPNSKGVIDIILDLKKHFNIIALKGNHEAMMIDFLTDPSSASAGMFILNGGSSTLASYSDGVSEHFVIPDDHLEFLYNLPLFYETEDFYFVHAGVPNVPLEQITAEAYEMQLLWIRSSFHNSQFNWGKTIVHGHTAMSEVEMTSSRINLDTGCVYKGKLSAMDLATKELYQIPRKRDVPKTFLKADPKFPRVASRFSGAIPVMIDKRDGSPGQDMFETLNYNEFGMLLREIHGKEETLFIGEVIQGVIGKEDRNQVKFIGEVVRTQEMKDGLYYGVKMIKTVLIK